MKAAPTPRIPGVYARPRPRVADRAGVRTDVVGFIGIDPRPPMPSPPDRSALVRCEDYRDYVLALGEPPDDGSLLGPAVRAFFANGGRRCWIALVDRPAPGDAASRRRVLDQMLGERGSSERSATGLERLLLQADVTIIDAPDLYARRVELGQERYELPPREREAQFLACHAIRGGAVVDAVRHVERSTTVFTSDPIWTGATTAPTSDVFDAQRAMLLRCVEERWRVLLLLSVPMIRDGDRFVAPSSSAASAWMRQFEAMVKPAPEVTHGFTDTDGMSCAALYWPWVLSQPLVGGPVGGAAPSAYAAGIVARRDLARGPEVSPANETLVQVVGLEPPGDDATHEALLSGGPFDDEPPRASVNVLRAFAGAGVQLWGARTLSTDKWLRFVSVRRTLTAIELRMKAALDELVFEPNTPILWLQITQVALGVLLPLFQSGALRGARPEEAFYVRCDATLNTRETLAAGRLYVEVGVAISAPAEFIVFRLGRREGVVEVLE